MEGACAALDALRARRLRIGVVTNQSGIGRGLITQEQLDAVNRRIDALLGPFDGWFVCPHAPQDDCECRKPKPKLLLDAARAFGVDVAACVFVGDKDEDEGAARGAGMRVVRIGPERTLVAACEEILTEREG